MDKKLILGLGVTLLLVLVLGVYIYNENVKKTTSQASPTSQNQSNTQASSSLTEPVTYEGVLPCADCSGIDTKLTLNPDGSYQMSEVYQGKNDDEPFISKGSWTIEKGTSSDPNAQVYVLTNENGEKQNYLIEEYKVTQLDQDKNPIEAPFNLSLTKVES